MSIFRCKFGQLGPGKGQFNSPHGFCLGTDEDIIVADTNNHRIQCFEKTGEFKYQFGIPGNLFIMFIFKSISHDIECSVFKKYMYAVSVYILVKCNQ